jgi:hypothetical protein
MLFQWLEIAFALSVRRTNQAKIQNKKRKSETLD